MACEFDRSRAAFRDSGLAHLLAVAGLHIGAVMLVMMLVVRTGLAAIPYLALRLPCKQIAAGARRRVGGRFRRNLKVRSRWVL